MFTLEEGEKMVKVVRRHFLVILPMAITLVIGAIFPFVIYKIISSGIVPFDRDIIDFVSRSVSRWTTFGYSLWLLLLWTVFFIEWTDYYLDIWILTDRRIIDVEQKGFFHREVTSLDYSQIQDITVETRGIIETFLKFGTLHIQTAGHNREIIIKDADRAEEARSLILSLGRQSRSI